MWQLIQWSKKVVSNCLGQVFFCITDGIYSWLVMSVKQHRDPCSGLPVDCVQTSPCLEKKEKKWVFERVSLPDFNEGRERLYTG